MPCGNLLDIHRLSVDNTEMLTVSDNRFLSGGRVGLWSNRYQLEVRNFKVLEMGAK